MQQNIQKLLHTEFSWLHMVADGKTWHSRRSHPFDTKWNPAINYDSDYLIWKCALSCGYATPAMRRSPHLYTLKWESWSWGGQICRRWKCSLFLSLLIINLNAEIHQQPPHSHRVTIFVSSKEVMFKLCMAVCLFVSSMFQQISVKLELKRFSKFVLFEHFTFDK